MDKPKLKEISKKLLEIHREIHGFYSEYAKSVELTLAGLEVLMIIWDEKECRQNTIAQKSFLPKQTVNAIIQKLLKDNIIKLSVEDSDKRNKIIRFTKKGQEYSNTIIPKVKDIEYRALDALGKEKREILVEIITTYKNNLKEE